MPSIGEMDLKGEEQLAGIKHVEKASTHTKRRILGKLMEQKE